MFDLLFRWFVVLGIDDAVWDHSTFTKNRDRLLAGDVAAQFLSTVLAGRCVKRLLSSEYFSVDGPLIQDWASMKSFRPVEEPRPGAGPNEPPLASGGHDPEADFRGEKRSNATHALITDPDKALSQGFRHGGAVCLPRSCSYGAPLRTHRRYLPDDSVWSCRPAATITLRSDRAYSASDFVHKLRWINVRPHVAHHLTRCRSRSTTDGRTTRHPGYAASQRIRKRIEEGFGWMKAVAGLDRLKLRGVDRVTWAFTFAAAYNLVRLPNLLATPA